MQPMSDGPRKTRYDTNPLAHPGDTGDTGERPEVDTEGPTRPLSPEAAVETDPGAGRSTSYRVADTGPYATTPAPDGHYAFMPPPPAHPAPRAQHATGQFPPHHSVSAQLGLTPNFAAMTCYLPFVGLVPSIVLTAAEPPQNTFVRFHANQGIVAHAAFWAITIAFSIARRGTPTVVSLLLILPELAFFVATVAAFLYLMVKTYRWQTVKIPIIGDQVA
jgi:uncharacterized membrane protein